MQRSPRVPSLYISFCSLQHTASSWVCCMSRFPLLPQESMRWGTWSTGSPGETPPCCRTRRWRPSVAPCTRSPAKTWRTPRLWPTRGASRSWSTSPRAEETGGLQQHAFVPTGVEHTLMSTGLATICTRSNALLEYTESHMWPVARHTVLDIGQFYTHTYTFNNHTHQHVNAQRRTDHSRREGGGGGLMSLWNDGLAAVSNPRYIQWCFGLKPTEDTRLLQSHCCVMSTVWMEMRLKWLGNTQICVCVCLYVCVCVFSRYSMKVVKAAAQVLNTLWQYRDLRTIYKKVRTLVFKLETVPYLCLFTINWFVQFNCKKETVKHVLHVVIFSVYNMFFINMDLLLVTQDIYSNIPCDQRRGIFTTRYNTRVWPNPALLWSFKPPLFLSSSQQDGWNQNHFLTPVSTLERDKFKSQPTLPTSTIQMSPVNHTGRLQFPTDPARWK